MRVMMLGPAPHIHTQRPLNGLLRSRCEVAYLSHNDPAPETAAGFRHIDYPPRIGGRYLGLFGERVYERVRTAVDGPALRRAHRRLQPDVVHVHYVDHDAYAAACAGLRPLVLSVWGTDINAAASPGATRAHRARVRTALEGADLVIVDAPDMPAKCEELVGRRLNTELLHLGVDADLFRPRLHAEAASWRERLNIPGEAFVVLSVRAWGEPYRHHLAIEALARALSSATRPMYAVFKLYNLGPYHGAQQYLADCKERAARLGVSDRVRWIKEIPFGALPGLYNAADAVVNLPVRDAFPVTFLEAAACCVPVITVRLPSYEGTFVEEFCHVLADDSVECLAAGLLEAAGAPHAADLARREQARSLVAGQYSHSRYISRLLEIYDDLAGARATGAESARAA